LVALWHECRLRLINAKVLFAFIVVISMCAFQDIFVRRAPRYLAFLVSVRMWSWMV